MDLGDLGLLKERCINTSKFVTEANLGAVDEGDVVDIMVGVVGLFSSSGILSPSVLLLLLLLLRDPIP